uniref:T-complex 11 like 1 n=1 Tax=Rhabditophanes sp. KR3021 TaxID=114890 RepID=A0AC35U190_9BILA
MRHQQFVSDVVAVVKKRFRPEIPHIKRSIDSLIERIILREMRMSVICTNTLLDLSFLLVVEDLLGECQSQAVVGTKELLKSNPVLMNRQMMNIIAAVARLIPDPKNDTHMTAQLCLLLDMICETSEL